MKGPDLVQFVDMTSPIRRTGQVALPENGWIRSVRDALGLKLSDLARRLSVTPPAIRAFELAEAQDRITLGSLRRVAAAMDCELVHVFVSPRGGSSISPPPAPTSEPAAEKVTDLTWHAQRREP